MPKFSIFSRTKNKIRVGLKKTTLVICKKTLWWFVGKFDGTFEKTDWNAVVRIGGKEATEVRVRTFNSKVIQAFL